MIGNKNLFTKCTNPIHIHTYITTHSLASTIHIHIPKTFFLLHAVIRNCFSATTLKGGRNKLYGQLIERPFPVYVNYWSATNTNRGSSVDKRCRDISAVAQDFNLVDPLLVILDSSSLTSNLEGITITPTKETCRSTIS